MESTDGLRNIIIWVINNQCLWMQKLKNIKLTKSFSKFSKLDTL
jgi:hypothetical protein